MPRLIESERAVAGRERQLDLSLVLSCGGWTLTMNATEVQRILLPEEVQWISRARAGEFLGVVGAARRAYAAFDLAGLLGRTEKETAWILTRVAHGHSVLPIALRSGLVRRVHWDRDLTLMPLPVGLTPQRPGVFTRAFRLRADQGTTLGLELGLDRLLLPAEKDLAVEALAAARRKSGTREH